MCGHAQCNKCRYRILLRYKPTRHRQCRQRKITATQADTDRASGLADTDLASGLIASGITTQPVETVVAVLAAHREGASINAAAKGTGINYRTAQRIVEAAAKYQQRELAVVS
jgi:response regulator of citrate/malate metabolism